ncbi:MAG TPA: GNAT family N-acetyltransferase [Clostridia bacterium]|nr:GNAT family N-acetyltransferase [Clostridia bacterium]
MEICFYGFEEIDNDKLKFAVVCASLKGRWIFGRHRERSTWETPGGHREPNEDIAEAAKRELYEESGAVGCTLEPVCIYSVTFDGKTDYGALFYADVKEIGPLPESEIGEVRLFKKLPAELTYPEIFSVLFRKVADYLTEKYIGLLNCDIVRNINIVQFLRSYRAYSFDRVGDSLLIRGTSDEDWVYISSASEEEFDHLIEGLDDEDKCFAVLEDWMLPAVIRGREISSRLTSMKLVYDDEVYECRKTGKCAEAEGTKPAAGTGTYEGTKLYEGVKPAKFSKPADDTKSAEFTKPAEFTKSAEYMQPEEGAQPAADTNPLPAASKGPCAIIPEVTDLTIPDAPVLYNNSDYREYISIGYIEERILNGTGVGIHKDGRLVGWALTHDDGAIGFLHVLEDYRRMGYAARITEAMVSRLIAAGEVPFLHIEESNAASMSLAVKAGFRKDRRIHWIKLA